MIHTCPRCELRFVSQAELEEHLQVDHHVDPEQFERFHYNPLPSRPAGRRYLVVANQTLPDEALLERLRDLVGTEGHIHLVVPATPVNPAADQTDDKSLALATFRMRRAVGKLHELGVETEGEVGAPDPVQAVARALQHEHPDEIVLSTLPAGSSRWLKVDVPTALTRRFGLPVTVVTSDAHPA